MNIPRPAPWLSFTLCVLIWGTTWLAIKEGYEGLDAVWAASLRFFTAATILGALAIARQTPFPRNRQELGVIAFVGLVLFGLDYGLIYWGEQFITSGLTAILFATMPFFVGIFSAILIPHERWTVSHAVGVLLGFLGLVAIFEGNLRIDSASAGPMLAIVVASAAAASSSVVMRRWGGGIPVLVLNGGAMFVGAWALLIASLIIGETPSLPATGVAWLSVVYLTIFGSVIAFLFYLDLLRRWTANRSSLIILLTPVVAVITGALALSERLTAIQWAGSLLVLGGVAVSIYVPRLSAPAPLPEASASARPDEESVLR